MDIVHTRRRLGQGMVFLLLASAGVVRAQVPTERTAVLLDTARVFLLGEVQVVGERVPVTQGPSFEIGGQVVYNSSRFSRIEGTTLTELDGFVEVDLEAVYRLRPQLRLEAGITNLLDANFERVAGYPEPGRTAFLRLHYGFQR